MIESLVAAAISSTLAAAAAGHFAQWRTQSGIEQVASAFETDVQHARSLALARNQAVRLSFEAAPDGACWVIHTGARGACVCQSGGAAQCTGNEQVFRVAHWPHKQPVRVESNVRSLSFDPAHGTASPTGTVRITGSGSKSVHQVVNIMGRVRSCVPGGGLAGYKAC